MSVVVFGAGGHGKVVADTLLAAGIAVTGFIDDTKNAGTLIIGLPVLGSTQWLDQHSASVALGIGDNAARAALAEALQGRGARLLTVVHPRAVVAPSASIGEGVTIMAGAVINADARVERGAIVNTGSIVEHDCVVGEFAHVSPNAAMAGGCRLGAFAHLGIGASMLPRTTVGAHAIVGGGALVSRNIAASTKVVGVPARVLGGSSG